MNTSRPINSLFWKISLVFILTLSAFAALTIYIFTSSTHDYNAEVNQQLNADLASHTVQEIKPYIEDGKVNEEGIGAIMHSMMTINPSVEVYLLDNEGSILSYVAPYKEVKMEKVSLAPIKEFITKPERQGILEGDDPREPGKCNIFSAAAIETDGVQTGYVYIVLAGQKYASATDRILSSYILGLSVKSILGLLGISLLLGLLAFWFFTKRLNSIVGTMRKFQDGDLDARLPSSGGQEFALIADTFNGMADTMKTNIEELKGVDKLRKELISNISHDLRTPISSIQGYAETLEMKHNTLDGDTQKEFLATIVKNSKRLNELVEGLFQLSKLESGQIDINASRFSIAELIHDVASKYRIISQKKGVSINTIVEKNSPLVDADISMIDRVLQNLIDNAIKFCSEGDYINIELDLAKPEQVRVSIADSGEGIPKEHLDHIFDRYYTGRSEKNKEGSGLGLSIAKKIIELHRGSIQVQSQLQAGTTFTFTLPRAA